MEQDRSWMYNKSIPMRGGLTDEFRAGLETFMKFASSQLDFMDGSKLRCPCCKCNNNKFREYEIVEEHLCRRGFTPNYYNWTCHGEPLMSDEEYRQTHQFPIMEECSIPNFEMNPYQRMVIDAAGQNFGWGTNNTRTLEHGSSSHPPQFEVPPETCEFDENLCNQFRDVLSSAGNPLWEGCDNHTQLSVTARMLNIKAEHNVSENCFNSFVEVMQEALPRDNIMPSNLYDMKKLMHNLGLPVVRIDVCIAGCMLYWKDDAYAESCKFCGECRFKLQRRQGRTKKRRSLKQLFYFPLIPRLQWLFASPATALHMTWHANHETEDDIMCHPSDADA